MTDPNTTDLPPQPLDPLHLPLCGSHLIEASAGTGKTFTIALLYLRLVLGHGRSGGPGADATGADAAGAATLGPGLLPPQILVVTFTEAATRELRDRIRRRLTEAAVCFDPRSGEQAPRDAPLLGLRQTIDPALWPECGRRLRLAAEWMDEAAVSTIHGWCQRMLNEHAFDSGSFFRQTLQPDLSELLLDVVRDYWRSFVYPLTPEQWALLGGFWQTPDALLGDLSRVLGDLPLPGISAQSPHQATAALAAELLALRRRWQGLAAELDALMDEALDAGVFDGRKLRRDWWQGWRDDLGRWSLGEGALLPALRDKAIARLTPSGLEEALKAAHAGNPLPQHEAWSVLAALWEWQAQLQQQRAPLLAHAAGWVAARLSAEKQRRAELGFDDLLQSLDRALNGPAGERLGGVIRERFPVALIDEFQDTDPVQYRIFDRVYGVAENRQDCGLLLIGDPKQAIYAFRGADIFTYLRARSATRGRHHALATNFRSAPQLVDAVNGLFMAADAALPEGAFLFRRGGDNPLPFVAVAAQGRSEHWRLQGEAPAPLHIWTASSEAPASKKAWLPEVAEACASEIARLLRLGAAGEAGFEGPEPSFEPLQARHVAVLVNKGDEAQAVRDALGRRGLASVYLSERQSVLETEVASDLLHWLRACAEPEQTALLRTALATPTLGQGHTELEALLRDELQLEAAIERFRGYRRQWQSRGVLPMLRSLLLDYRVPARLLTIPGGERQLTDLLHLAELLQQESQQLDGEHALIRHLQDLRLAAAREAELLQQRLESDASLIQVVTVHKSKGLEYPLVFLPFAFNGRPESARQTLVRWHDEQGQVCIAIDPDDEAVRRADRERLGEDVRKLYVALTRARHALWLCATPVKGWRQSALGHLIAAAAEPDSDGDVAGPLRQLLGDLPQVVIGALPEADDLPGPAPPPAALGEALQPRQPLAEHWWIASYSALRPELGMASEEEQAPDSALEARALDAARGDVTAPAATDRAAPLPVGVHAFPRGAATGTFLHGLLEWAAGQGFARVAADPAALRVQLERRCQLRGWGDRVALLEAWLLRLLTAPLPLPGATPSLAGLTGYQPELEFWLASHTLDSAAIDRALRSHILPGEPRPALAPAQLNGMLKGFIDLVFEHQGRYYVLDYKSNALGTDDAAYDAAAMSTAALDKRFDLQCALYLLALHRLLRARLPDYDYDRHIGAAGSLFLRGLGGPAGGVWALRPPRALVDTLDHLFAGGAGEATA